MASLKFFLNNNTSGNEINVETNATFTEQISTFDNGTFTIEWNLTKEAIAPQTKFFIEYTDDLSNVETWSFIIINDEVEIVRKIAPVKYLHHLTLMQNTNALTKNILRNSVFSQPSENKVRAEFSISGWIRLQRDSQTSASWINGNFHYNNMYDNPVAYTTTIIPNFYSRTFNILTRQKIARAYLDIETIQQVFRKDEFNYQLKKTDYYNAQNWYSNLHQDLYLKVERYLGSTLNSTKNIHITQGQTYYEFDLQDNFFIGGYTYKVVLDTDYTSTFQQIDLSGITFDLDADAQATHDLVFTNIKAKLHLTTYYYSLYDVLNTIRNQYKKDYNNSSNEDIYDLPQYPSEQFNTLFNTVAPEFNFTGKDIYSCVAEVMSYIDAIPTLSADNTLGFVYLNDQSKTPLENVKIADVKQSLSQENYTNRLVANYQNGKQETAITYPAKNLFARVGSNVYGVPDRQNYYFKVDKPIDCIDKVYLFNNGIEYGISLLDMRTGQDPAYNRLNYHFTSSKNNRIDITNSIIEHSLYSLLAMADGNTIAEDNQLNSFYFSKGGKDIYVGAITKNNLQLDEEVYKYALNKEIAHSFGVCVDKVEWWGGTEYQFAGLEPTTIPNKRDLQFNITYHAIFDGKVAQESIDNKYEGETYSNQSNANVSLNRMGNAMQGLIAKMGNETKRFVLPVSNYGSRIKIGSLWVDDDGNKYIANIIKTTFSTSSQKVIVNCEFSKNFNMLSQYTQIDQERRFYEISENLTSKGYENIGEFIYFSKSDQSSKTEYIAMTFEGVETIIKTFYPSPLSVRKCEIAGLNSYEYYGQQDKDVENIYCPMHTYGSGNAICFEFGYDSPINAGDRLTGEATSESPLLNKTTLYTASSGFADCFDIQLYAYLGNSVYCGEDFPLLESFLETATSQTLKTIVKIDRLGYYKKPNEIFHLNYSINFMPYFTKTTNGLGRKIYKYEEIYFGDQFINKNNIIANNGYEGTTKRLYLWVSNELYSLIDNKAFGTKLDTITTAFNTYHNSNANGETETHGDITFTPTTSGTTITCKSWCIADEYDNVYISCNQTLTNATETKLYFFTSKHRKLQ